MNKKDRKKYENILKLIPNDSQNHLVLKHILENGSITPKEAERKPIYCMRLSARVWDLKHKYEIPIEVESVSKKTSGKLRHFAKYYIA